MIASDDAAIAAPPRPWTARATISTPLVGARPPLSEARPNSSSAATNVRRCPKMSATRPESIKKPANTIAYASTTHCRSADEKRRLSWIDGSATFTIERSRITMNCAMQQTPSRRPLPGSLRSWGGSGAGSLLGVRTPTLMAGAPKRREDRHHKRAAETDSEVDRPDFTAVSTRRRSST